MERVAGWLVRHPRRVVVATPARRPPSWASSRCASASRARSRACCRRAIRPSRTTTRSARQFGSDDVGVVGVVADDLFAPATLEKIARVTDALGKLAGRRARAQHHQRRRPGRRRLQSAAAAAAHPADAGRGRARCRRSSPPMPLYGKNLVADDFRGAAINVFFEPHADAQYADLDVDRQIARDPRGASRGPSALLLHRRRAREAGRGRADAPRPRALHAARAALVLVVPVALVPHQARRAAAARRRCRSRSCGRSACMVLAGKAITLGTFILPPLLLVVGSSYAIHVMARYYEQVARRAPAERGGRARLRARVAAALDLGARRRSIGFGSLMVNRITAIWELGRLRGRRRRSVVAIVCAHLPARGAARSCRSSAWRGARATASPALERHPRRGWRARSPARRGRSWWVAGGARRCSRSSACAASTSTPTSSTTSARARGAARRTRSINREIVGRIPFYLVIEGRRPGALQALGGAEADQGPADVPAHAAGHHVVDLDRRLPGAARDGAQQGRRAATSMVDEQGDVVPQPRSRRPFWEDPAQPRRRC